MNFNELHQFLLDSNAAGYATGDEKKWVKEPDGSTTIPYSKGDWRMHDNFFGGEPYGGRLVVFHQEKPVWLMVYYGWVVAGIVPQTVYSVLQEALKNMPAEAPFRGPKKLEKDGLTYKNDWTGDLDRFEGHEQILRGENVVYEAHYQGGMVDQRGGV